ncbi:acetyl-CoA C-acetyltransferase [Rhodobacteraceae bacterium D3-12]|nr:acetyl-CoA C-acetyltransferase [Rhodobacteraceae bacterium D3-12]
MSRSRHLGATVVKAVVERTGIDPMLIEDLVFAQSYANGETPCIGRWLALSAGLPLEVPGMQLDRRCGGGLQSIATAAMMVETGVCDVVLAGGVESMSRVEFYTNDMRWGKRAGSTKFHDRLERGRERSQPVERFGKISGMVETAENLARDYGISREEADSFSVSSHHKAATAWADGRFAEEVVPVSVPQRKGEARRVSEDEGIRPETSVESLGKLRPIMQDGIVTAGNSSQQNDAAAACLVVAEDKLHELSLTPSAFLAGWAAAGCEPSHMGIGPVPATTRVMAKSGMTLDQMDLIEVNEAFACQVLSVLREWGVDADDTRLNVNGSGISLGHPIGATGSRIMTSMLHEMPRRKARFALETMCIGGGQGMAAIFENA